MKKIYVLFLIFNFSFLAKAQNKVSMITTDWPPYYSKTLSGGGHITEIVKEAFKNVGKVSKVKWVSWKRAQIQVEKGIEMVLLGAYKNPEREKIYHFNKIPLGHTVSGIFSLEGNNFKANSLEDFKDHLIGILRGTSISPKFDKATFLKKKEYNTEDGALRVLSKKRIKFVAGDWYVFNTLIKNKNINIKLNQALILDKIPLYLGFSKKVPKMEALRDQFDKGLKNIQSSGKVKEILTRYGF